MESLPAVRGARWLVVNTMQAGDSGLMLLTSDGSLANALRRRAETIPAAYVARVLVPTPEFDATTLPLVVNYDDARIEFDSIEPAGGEGTNRWFRVESRRAHRRAAVRALVREPRIESEPRDPGAVRATSSCRAICRAAGLARLSPDRIEELYALAGLELPQPEQRAVGNKPQNRRRPPPDRRATGKRKSGR